MTTTDAGLAGKPCPKCGYVRVPADTNPAWQCPRCHIAYLKFQLGAPLRTRLVAGGRELASEGASDRSAYALVATNLIAAAVAVIFRMDLRDLMMAYWAQSVIIGFSFFVRILSLQQYSTEGFRGGRGGGKIFTALFFLFHYGGFHAGYLVFLATGPGSKPGVIVPDTGLVLCTLAFALNHAYSLAHNIRLDRSGCPNLVTMMFLPYARVVPMHLTIIFVLGEQFASGMQLLTLFIGLKTAADVVMHVIEHHILRKGGSLWESGDGYS